MHTITTLGSFHVKHWANLWNAMANFPQVLSKKGFGSTQNSDVQDQQS